MFEFLKKKKEVPKNITGKEICEIYYTLQSYYDGIAPNIAVIKNKKKFDWQIKVYTERLKLEQSDKVIKTSEDRYTFIIDGRETTIILIRDLSDFERYNLYFKRFM